jgi:alpha-glucosidase (family GH31 glycosyl hydrolase)
MNAKRRFLSLAFVCFVSCFSLLPAVAQERLGVQRKIVEAGNRYLAVEILDDDLAHFELSEHRTGPDPAQGIYITPMVDQAGYKNYPGPTRAGFSVTGHVIETSDMRITVEENARCARIVDKVRGVNLTRICGEDLDQDTKRLRLERQDMQHVYGVGNLFYDPSTADGDWVGRHWEGRKHGNFRFGTGGPKFHNGDPSVSQFPVIYALGPKVGDGTFQNYGLFLDHVYRMSWDFQDHANWYATMWGDQIRWFVMTGPNLKDLRSDFMELVGRPPVPPRHAFGLWISEFGYDNWTEIRNDLDSLVSNRFPVDGVALDLQWFGGSFAWPPTPENCTPDRMGSLTFNGQNFPSPSTEIPKFREEYGVQFMAIEESYIDNRLPEHTELWNRKFLARVSDAEPVTVTGDIAREGEENHCMWWGRGGMLDWSHPEAGRHWHQQKRLPLASMGILGHWLDLGEPEMYYQDALYHGFPELGKHRHGDIHNVYNLFWAKSIFDGYQHPDNQQQLKQALGLHAPPRHFVLSRAGTVGSQRYTAMWTGDVAKNMGNLRAHLQTQLHMSLAGMDYYTSDAGGFLAVDDVEPGHDKKELYTQWFANNALLDIPLRPHAWAYGEGNNNIRITPDHGGHLESNRANLRLRYELTPYVYSLAHRAQIFGEPIFPPLVYHFQDDPNVRRMGNIKMIGDALLFGVVAGYGQTDRRVYLPRGRWVDYHSRAWYQSAGQETPAVPVYRDRHGQQALFTIPLFARAGAIIPQMYVDENTRNVSGRRDVNLTTFSEEERQKETMLTTELRVKVFAGSDPTSFTLYEDDGITLDYRNGNIRETRMTQQADADRVRVTIHEAHGTFRNAISLRANVVELIVEGREASAVEVNGHQLPRLASSTEFEAGKIGWHNAGHNLIQARSEVHPLERAKNFVFQFALP